MTSALKQAAEATRATCVAASLELDIVRYAVPVLAAVKPGALFSCPYTRRAREEIKVDDPYVMLLGEFAEALQRCQSELEPHGVRIEVLAWRERSALLLVYRPALLEAYLEDAQVSENLTALGYRCEDPQACIDELANRIHDFDTLERSRDFWHFPHEVGYFLGYPAPDVMAFCRNRGQGYAVTGEWRAYGCHRRAHVMRSIFQELQRCAQAYWRLYLEGAQIGQLAALGSLSLECASDQ